MSENHDLEDRLRTFLAESTSAPPPPGMADSVEQPVTGRWSGLGRLVASAVTGAAIVAVAILVLVTHTANLHSPQGGKGSTSPFAAPSPKPTPTPTANLLRHVDSVFGQQQCLGYVQQHATEHAQLEAEYDMTAGEVNSWDHKILPSGAPSDYVLRDVAPATPLYFCFIHGEFAVPVPPGAPVPDRIDVAIDGRGKPYEFTYGFSSTFPARPVG